MAVCHGRGRAFYGIRLHSFSLGIRYRLHIDGVYRLSDNSDSMRQLVVLGDDSDKNYHGDYRAYQHQYRNDQRRDRQDKIDCKVHSYKRKR